MTVSQGTTGADAGRRSLFATLPSSDLGLLTRSQDAIGQDARRRFLFTTLPSNDLGLLTRSLPIASELAGRGHKVAFCSPGQAPSKLIAEAGFDNLLPRHPLYHLMAAEPSLRGLHGAIRAARREWGLTGMLSRLPGALPTRLAPVTPEIWNMDHLGALTGMRNEGFVRANCEALMAVMQEHGADVVVDFWNPFACIATRALRKPLVTVIQADMHPASRGFVWWKESPLDYPTPVPAVNRVLAAYDLPLVDTIGELILGDRTLVVGMPETDPLPEGTRVAYVGPILWQRPGAGLPDWVGGLSREKPVIWVYAGNPRYLPFRTPMDSDVILDACVAALAGEPGWQVVLTTGHHTLPRKLLPLPAHFRCASFVPGLAMAERSDLLIHHGGYGSCQTGLYTGTPAVIIPNYSERESNARRVAAAGAGDVVLPVGDGTGKRRVPVEQLRAKVQQVLADPAYARNARRAGEKLRAYGGAPEAARLIEDVALGSRTPGYDPMHSGAEGHR
jgi:UDP:flavonoid glycosyltransferase YjiC (YdhE family)